MPRLQVELTSARPDGSWTWRVSGARQPRGILDPGLAPPGAKVGDVLRVEAVIELDGTTVTAVLPEALKRPDKPQLVLLGPATPETGGVTTSLAARSPGDETARARRGVPDRIADIDHGGLSGRTRPRRGGRGTGEPPAAQTRGPRQAQTRGPRQAEMLAPEKPSRAGGAGLAKAHQPEAPPAKRLTPANTHRASVLDSLPPAQRAVAEQLLHGGLAAVRRALAEQNEQARASGQATISSEPIVTLAEELLPRLKAAEWHDRAEAAAAAGEEIALKDLRSVVAGADAGARDDDARLLAKTLRETLETREAQERETWLRDVSEATDSGRLVRALRLLARPPDARTKAPVELTDRLTNEASAALAPETAPERWLTVLEAVIASPLRRGVKPVGLPRDAGEELVHAARQASGRVPALGALLGITMPPPPGPRRVPPRKSP